MSESTLVPNPILLNELRAQKEALLRERDLRKNYGIHFYRPHEKQHKFHSSNKKGRYGRTGNRFGKSEMGICETLSHCIGGRLWYKYAFDILNGERQVVERHLGGDRNELITKGIAQRPIKALLLVVDWDMAKKVFTNQTDDPNTCGKIFKFLPKELLGKVHLSRGGHVDQIEIKRPAEFGGGISTLTIDTIEAWKHNKLGGESADWDLIHIDEPIPEEMFKSYSRGLMDRNGKYYFTCTPLDQMWINKLFTPKGRYNLLEEQTSPGFTFEDRFIITGAIYDNPYRNDEGVAGFESTLTKAERDCRLLGIPLNLAGLVYKEFVYDLHVLSELPKGWEAYHLPPKDYTCRVAWDVHDAIPQALLFIATAPTGEAFVCHELFFDKLITPNAKALQEWVKGRFVPDYLIDPRAVIESPVTGESILDKLMEFGLWFERGSKDMELGISSTREKLNERREMRSLGGEPVSSPTIYFCPNCEVTIGEIMQYCYNSKTQKPVDKDDHMVENLRRLILNGLEYISPPKDSDWTPRAALKVGYSEDRKPLPR